MESPSVPRQKNQIVWSVLICAASIAAWCAFPQHRASAAQDAAEKTSQAGPSGYRLLKRITLGGDGSWDYLAFDSPTRRLFISRGSKVEVVDVDSNKAIGEIPNTPGVHGIALAPEMGRGFTSNGRNGTVTIFDLSTLHAIGEVQAGRDPDAILYDHGSKRVFVMNGQSHDVTAIDASTGKALATIPLKGRPESAVADGAGHVYVNLADTNEQVQMDSQSLTVESRWPVAPCRSPTGLAMDVAHRRLFAGCENRMLVVTDADTGKVIVTRAIGQGVGANRFDPGTGLIFSSNGEDATLTVIHEDGPDHYTIVENIPTQLNARTMALDLKTHEIYLAAAALGAAEAATEAATETDPSPEAAIVPGSFVILVYAHSGS
ncbi:MAG: PQQ-binding-like beta-propeller repeat protein [Candidatus Acidiferrales bacterium]